MDLWEGFCNKIPDIWYQSLLFFFSPSCFTCVYSVYLLWFHGNEVLRSKGCMYITYIQNEGRYCWRYVLTGCAGLHDTRLRSVRENHSSLCSDSSGFHIGGFRRRRRGAETWQRFFFFFLDATTPSKTGEYGILSYRNRAVDEGRWCCT